MAYQHLLQILPRTIAPSMANSRCHRVCLCGCRHGQLLTVNVAGCEGGCLFTAADASTWPVQLRSFCALPATLNLLPCSSSWGACLSVHPCKSVYPSGPLTIVPTPVVPRLLFRRSGDFLGLPRPAPRIGCWPARLCSCAIWQRCCDFHQPRTSTGTNRLCQRSPGASACCPGRAQSRGRRFCARRSSTGGSHGP